MEYEIVRSKRKTVAIEVKEDKIIVKCPYRCSKAYIDSVINKNKLWIEQTHKKIMERGEKRLKYVDGQIVYYLGRPYELEFNYDLKNSLQFKQDKFIFTLEASKKGDNTLLEEMAKDMLMNWFRKEAKEYLNKRTFEIADKLGVSVNKVYIKNVKTIWGSCSSKNNINYNIKLISMPEGVIDYVIIHELCHTLERNHSNKFWALVEKVIPDYKERRNFLNTSSSKYCNW
ncbi:SprT family zinc-dependent metalloprotease [Clostridium sp. C8-1-8]|uniref:M48 family metallopeptidase n=1 Tax=Clostridium sp. C8-1-8 TaxID=2698831 RepID=UPI00136B8368|nr:SprT family zinc-dependent metalloprotease [Clostridium sp. C8-1-8]